MSSVQYCNIDDIRDHIAQVFQDIEKHLEKATPKFVRKVQSISISDVRPVDLPQFIKDNNIPDECYFTGRDNGYDAFDDIQIAWEIMSPAKVVDIYVFKKTHLNNHLVSKCLSMLGRYGIYRGVYVHQTIDHCQFFIDGDVDGFCNYLLTAYTLRKVI